MSADYWSKIAVIEDKLENCVSDHMNRDTSYKLRACRQLCEDSRRILMNCGASSKDVCQNKPTDELMRRRRMISTKTLSKGAFKSKRVCWIFSTASATTRESNTDGNSQKNQLIELLFCLNYFKRREGLISSVTKKIWNTVFVDLQFCKTQRWVISDWLGRGV